MYDQLKLENQLCFRLYTASRLINQGYEPYFKPLGITYTQYLVLLVLWEYGELPINTIGKKLLLGINTVSPLIKRMEKMGIVERRGTDTDKRKQIISLTPKGKDMEKEAAEIPGCLAGDINSCGIPTENLQRLIPELDEILDKMGYEKKNG